MLDKKQTQEAISPRMIDPNELSKDEIRSKNIIQAVATTNRGPRHSEPTDGEGSANIKGDLASSANRTGPIVAPGLVDAIDTLSQSFKVVQENIPQRDIAPVLKGIQSQGEVGPSAKKPFGAGQSIEYGSDSLEVTAPMHQSSQAIGISTLQLEHQHSQREISISKRATNMSGLASSPNASKKLLKPKSLIARLPIPAMDKEQAKQFNIRSTLNLSERSPLIQQEQKNNQYARMPTIFATVNADDDNLETSLEDSGSPIKGIRELVEEGGSAAYQLYQAQSDKMLRDRLAE